MQAEGAVAAGVGTSYPAKGKSILFVDFPQLARGGVRYEFYELFRKLRLEFDEIRVFARIPKDASNEKDVWGLIRVATNAGAFPTLYPCGVDGFIVEEIRRCLERGDVGEIALLSGDGGFSEVLRTAKRRGVRVKVLLPSDGSHLLKDVADEVVPLESYSPVHLNRAARNSIALAAQAELKSVERGRCEARVAVEQVVSNT